MPEWRVTGPDGREVDIDADTPELAARPPR
jgi:hypothetical protein